MSTRLISTLLSVVHVVCGDEEGELGVVLVGKGISVCTESVWVKTVFG